MTTYFSKIFTIEELKRQYRRLVIENHPDAGGSEEVMKQINKEYEELLKEVANIHEKPGEPGKTYKTKEGAFEDGYRAVMDALAGLAAKGYISVELCGSWLWISGDTRNFKDYIKATGCKWSGKKKMWYWHPGDFKRRGHGWTIERIRERFGSEALEFANAPEVAIPF